MTCRNGVAPSTAVNTRFLIRLLEGKLYAPGEAPRPASGLLPGWPGLVLQYSAQGAAADFAEDRIVF
jgi:hypothetical protein